MTKENILAKLKNKYGNLGLSDEIMGAQSDFLLSLTPTEETIEAMIGGIEPTLKTFQSNLDKLRNRKPDPVPPTPPTPPTPPADDMPAWAKELLTKVDAVQNQQTSKQKSENLIAKLKAENVPEKFYNRFLNTVDYSTDYDEGAIVESFKADYNDFKQTFANDGASGITDPIIAPQDQKANAVKSDIERLA